MHQRLGWETETEMETGKPSGRSMPIMAIIGRKAQVKGSEAEPSRADIGWAAACHRLKSTLFSSLSLA